MAVKINVGRQRVTSVTGPHEAGYTRSIRQQMRVIQQNLEHVVGGIDNAMPQALKFGLQPIFDLSQELVPVDTAKLKNSGFLEIQKTSTGAAAAIGYGKGGQPFYTGIVHERLDLRHARGKQAKFLEEPVNRLIDTFARRVVLYVQRETGLTE